MYIFLILYLIFIFYLSIRGYDKEKSDTSYFFSSYQTTTFKSIISIFATETSVATILIFPAIGYAKNFNIVFLCLGYLLGRIVVAFFYLKHFHHRGFLSMYEYITETKSKNYLSFAYLLAKYISGSVRFYMAGYGLQQLTNIRIEIWLAGSMFLIAIYSLTGGLKSVILTDQIQGILIIITGIIFLFHFISLDSFHSTQIWWDLQLEPTKSLLLFFGSFLLTLSSHGSDQDILQRIFSVKELKKAQISMILSGFVASIVILIFVLTGYFLISFQELDQKSPLLDFITRVEQYSIYKGLFLVLIVAAAMSTMDSSIHSTGAIWKSILNESHIKLPNYVYSMISLISMYILSNIFIFVETKKDFLSFALGSMNYVNGTLFSTVLLFILFKKKLNVKIILLILFTNIIITTICEYFQFYFALTTILSFLIAFFVGFIFIKYYEKT